jgi:hypothetical protein
LGACYNQRPYTAVASDPDLPNCKVWISPLKVYETMEHWKEQGPRTWGGNRETKNLDAPSSSFDGSVEPASHARTFPLHRRPRQTFTKENDQRLHVPNRDSECGSDFQTSAKPIELLNRAQKVLSDYNHRPNRFSAWTDQRLHFRDRQAGDSYTHIRKAGHRKYR